MNLVIFGPTGTIGRELVEQALEHGHAVTAIARNPDAIGSPRPNLRVVHGDVLNRATFENALNGQDAVLCALGAGRKGALRAEGTRNVIQAMESAGVRRLICLTSLGVGDSRGNLNFFWKHIVFGLFLKDAYRDHEVQETHIRESGLDWTIVRPAAFTDGERTETYRHGFPATERGMDLEISRANVADFMLKQVTNDAYLRKAPGLVQ